MDSNIAAALISAGVSALGSLVAWLIRRTKDAADELRIANAEARAEEALNEARRASTALNEQAEHDRAMLNAPEICNRFAAQILRERGSAEKNQGWGDTFPVVVRLTGDKAERAALNMLQERQELHVISFCVHPDGTQAIVTALTVRGINAKNPPRRYTSIP